MLSDLNSKLNKLFEILYNKYFSLALTMSNVYSSDLIINIKVFSCRINSSKFTT